MATYVIGCVEKNLGNLLITENGRFLYRGFGEQIFGVKNKETVFIAYTKEMVGPSSARKQPSSLRKKMKSTS